MAFVYCAMELEKGEDDLAGAMQKLKKLYSHFFSGRRKFTQIMK